MKAFSPLAKIFMLTILVSFLVLMANAKEITAIELTQQELANIPDEAYGSLFEEDDSYVPDKDGYGRKMLEKMDRAEEYLYAYDELEEGIRNFEIIISLVNDGSFTKEEVDMLLEAYTSDHPERFWFSGSYGYGEPLDSMTTIYPIYSLYEDVLRWDTDSAAAATFKTLIETDSEMFQDKVDGLIEEMYEKVSEKSTDFETGYAYALWLHDRVCDIVTYEFGPNHQTAYGALVDGRAVCAGYAELYQYLLHEAGIEAWSVKGESYNQARDEYVGHEWTLMWIDGICLYTDVTWDDQGHDTYHLYFAREYHDFEAGHTPDAGFYADSLPVCDREQCSGYGYFEVAATEHTMTPEYSADKIGALLYEKIEDRVWHAVMYDPTNGDFLTWMLDNNVLGALVGKYIPYGSLSYGYSMAGTETLGMEIHLTISLINDTHFSLTHSDYSGLYTLNVIRGYEYASQYTSVYIVYFDENGKTNGIEMKNITAHFTEYDFILPKDSTSFKAFYLLDGKLMPLSDFVGNK